MFTLSLDFELIWGTRDKRGQAFRRQCERERSVVIDRLLTLLASYDISATWCVLGHLFLDHCLAVDGRMHPEIVPPHHSWVEGDWFVDDPGTSEQADPIYYGRSLVTRIRDCPTPQEIGCHSFSHVIFGDPGCSRETAASELQACARLAKELGITLRSFAFPRNRVGHLEALRERGIVCFRGPEPNWHERLAGLAAVKRAGHLLDVTLARTPPVGLPIQVLPGLWNIPASMMFFPSHGPRRCIPMAQRVRRASKGLDRAERERRILHMWFHPTNLADHTDAMFAALERILADAASRRDGGRLEVRTMSELVPNSPASFTP